MMTPGEGRDSLRRTLFEMLLLMVDWPSEVRVVATLADRHVVLQVSVAAEDVGKVVGKQGRTARSLRTILSAGAVKLGVTCDLNICGAASEGTKTEADLGQG